MFLRNISILSCMYYVKEKTNFCRNCLQAFSTEEISKYHINEYFKVNFKQIIQKSEEENKNMEEKSKERKIKPPCKIYADIESILVPQDNKKKHSDESYNKTNKKWKHDACSCGYKLACANDKFSKSFKSYLGKHNVYNFINNMIQVSKYCTDITKKYH